MNFKLDRSVPSGIKFAVQHLEISFDTPEEMTQARGYADAWFKQEWEKLTPEEQANLKDGAPRPARNAAPAQAGPAPTGGSGNGEWNEILRRIGGHIGKPVDPAMEEMLLSWATAYTKQGSSAMTYFNSKTFGLMAQTAQEKGWKHKVSGVLNKISDLEKMLAAGDGQTITYSLTSNKVGETWVPVINSLSLYPVPPGATPDIPKNVVQNAPEPAREDYVDPFAPAPSSVPTDEVPF